MDVPLMRKISMTGAALALVLTASSVSAKNDFEALLGDLTFGEAPTENLTLDVAAQNAAETLKPAPAKSRGFTLPDALETKLEPANEPIVALKDPIPATQPAQIDTPSVDFETMFKQQDATDSALASEVTPVLVGHKLHARDVECCDTESCDDVIVCRPREVPSLPTSTILEYFRSNTCHTHIWDGYEQECRQYCGDHHKHIHGECDCFNKKGKGFSCHSRRNCDACESCDGR